MSNNVDEAPHPEHPIVLPPDTETPPDVEPVPPDPPPTVDNELSFYQRKTLGVNWQPEWIGDPGSPAFVDAASGDADYVNVRTILNDGSTSVTYPSDFTGDVKIRVRGESGSVEGATTVT